LTLLVKFYYPLKKLLDIKSPFDGYIKLERIRRIRTEREKQDTMKPSYKTRKSLRLSVISFILIILLLSLTSLPAFAQDEHTGGRILYAGGIPFGVKFFSRGVIISGFCDIPVSGGENRNPAVTAGLKLNDIIISVNGKEPESCEEFLSIIENSGGSSLKITYTREDATYSTSLVPVYSKDEGKYKCGMYIRQGGAGIGTVTYIDPDTLEFGGHGHGICDAQTGKVLPISHGVVMDVKISGIVRGKAGAPGEIKGSFDLMRVGFVRCNTDCGVFGVFSAVPKGTELKKYPIATRSEVKEGKAHILCTLDESGKVGCYSIEISAINRESRDNKSFSIKVTDDTLIAKSGGIVQGMSGSTIIQGNRIIGAVTHVMINDPTVGYGIFIENMLDRAADSAS